MYSYLLLLKYFRSKYSGISNWNQFINRLCKLNLKYIMYFLKLLFELVMDNFHAKIIHAEHNLCIY